MLPGQLQDDPVHFYLTFRSWGASKYRVSADWNQGSRRMMSRLNEFTEHEVEVEQLLFCSAGASFYTMAPNGEGAAKGLSPDPRRNSYLTPVGVKD